MATSEQSGSVDEWLSKAPLASERKSSPFKTVCHTARGLKSSQSMPAARTSDPIRSGSDRHLPSLAALVRNVPDCTSTCPREVDAGRLDEEGCVRNGRLRLTVSIRSDAQPITRAACPSSAGPSDFLESAASLPAMATQGAFGFESLCSALSSPASTLATANSRGTSYNGCKTAAAATTTATDAATAAFSRSLMISIPRPPRPDSPPPSSWSGATPSVCLLPNIGGWPHDKPLAVCATPEQSACCNSSSPFPPIDSPSSRRGAADAGLFCGGVGGARSGAGGQGSPGSCRRGLSEGTVRGGSPRNSWRYCSAV